MKNKKLLLSVTMLSLALAGAAVYGGVKAFASTDTSRHQEIVSSLASKLGVTEDKVSTALSDIDKEKQTAMEAARKTKLDEAVKAGVITQDQEDKLIAKETEVKAAEDNIQSDLQQWYLDNGIDTAKLAPYAGRGGMMNGKGMGGRGRGGEAL